MEGCTGENFGLLGPKSAGKTMLIETLTTLLPLISGDAWINGIHIKEEENMVCPTEGCMLISKRG